VLPIAVSVLNLLIVLRLIEGAKRFAASVCDVQFAMQRIVFM
jgi:hypothetical protein